MASTGTSDERAFALCGSSMRIGASMSTRLSNASAMWPFRYIAGRATTSPGLKNRARKSAAASRSPASIPAKPAHADELRSDLDKALALVPGSHRLNLHASYAETHGQKVERDALAA